MDQKHVIRLRGPWQYESIQANGEVQQAEMLMPAACSTFADMPWRRLSFVRRFGCPTGLTPSSQVHLVISRPRWPGQIEYNGSEDFPQLSPGETMRIDVSGRMQRRNELVIRFDRTEQVSDETEAPAETGEEMIIEDVHLEISESPATNKGLRLET